MRDEEIAEFIETGYARVVRAVRLACGDQQQAEDAVQEAVVDVWAKRREVNDLAGWITVVALNRARSRWRRAAAERRAFERLARQANKPASDTSDRMLTVDAQVADALSALTRKQREVVALHYLLDMSVVEVAAQLQIAEGTAKAHLHRGRNALRAALTEPAHPKEVNRVGP